jgi:putative lipoic acid-binding regulatory protein
MSESRDENFLEFPCDFPIKMMGRDRPEFREAAVALIENHVDKFAEGAIRTAASRNGRFLSITITIQARNRQQLDDIYRDLTAHREILYVL